jgi:hypothetical protein
MRLLNFFRALSTAAAVGFGLAGGPAQATLIIDPADALGTIAQTSNCDQACLSAILGFDVIEYYKANSDDDSEEKSLAGAYSTVFSSDNETATISWDGPAMLDCGTCILLVKDGRNQPNQIYFDLTALGWDGMEDIFVSDPLIWPNGGSISHVSLFAVSGPTTSVPEPGTLLLLGAGLVGLAGVGRRRVAR